MTWTPVLCFIVLFLIIICGVILDGVMFYYSDQRKEREAREFIKSLGSKSDIDIDKKYSDFDLRFKFNEMDDIRQRVISLESLAYNDKIDFYVYERRARTERDRDIISTRELATVNQDSIRQLWEKVNEVKENK